MRTAPMRRRAEKPPEVSLTSPHGNAWNTTVSSKGATSTRMITKSVAASFAKSVRPPAPEEMRRVAATIVTRPRSIVTTVQIRAALASISTGS
jgi:hypothetical protein